MNRSNRALKITCATLVAACATNPVSSRRPSPPSTVSVGCLDTLHATDSLWRVVKLSVTAQNAKQRLPTEFESFFAQEFRRRFRLPSNLPLTLVMGTPPCDSVGMRCSGGYLDLAAVAYATAHYDGKLSDIAVIDASLSPALADSVRATLIAIGESGLAPTSEDDSLPLIIRLDTEENPDTVPELSHLFRAKIPHYALPFKYASMPASGVRPRYPFMAGASGIGDSVTIAFTVDAEGRIAPASLELVRASYSDFVSSVVNALQQTRYHPARLGDCPVSTRMSQRFLFTPP